MTKIKFEYHHLDNTLYIQTPNSPPQEIPQSFTTDWGSPGFVLEPINHWITFGVWADKIRVFYKEVESHPTDLWGSEVITYFQKDLPKQDTIIFTFTPQDQVQKVNGKWAKKSN